MAWGAAFQNSNGLVVSLTKSIFWETKNSGGMTIRRDWIILKVNYLTAITYESEDTVISY
jgi:hypothetical protein